MGYDAVRGIATYGAGCMPGCTRQFAWWQAHYGAGSLGCYNPASKAGSGPSLHAEGRAMDIALNANDPAERARGDAIFDRVMANPEQFGAQEMLWRGYIWSWNRRSEGKRGPGVQQAAHMNHVHLGLDVNAAQNWNESWVGAPPDAPVPRKKESEMFIYRVKDGPEANTFWLKDGPTIHGISGEEFMELAANGATNAALRGVVHDDIKTKAQRLSSQDSAGAISRLAGFLARLWPKKAERAGAPGV